MLTDDVDGVEATVFAGYKQDVDGQPTRRACELVDAERNVVVVLPSVLANAVPNALQARALIRQRGEATTPAPDLPSGAGVPVGPLTEDAGQVPWTDWGDFARSYRETMG